MSSSSKATVYYKISDTTWSCSRVSLVSVDFRWAPMLTYLLLQLVSLGNYKNYTSVVCTKTSKFFLVEHGTTLVLWRKHRENKLKEFKSRSVLTLWRALFIMPAEQEQTIRLFPPSHSKLIRRSRWSAKENSNSPFGDCKTHLGKANSRGEPRQFHSIFTGQREETGREENVAEGHV